MITGYGTIESAVEAIKMGAYDYLTKPIVDDEIRMLVSRALDQQALLEENRNLKDQLRSRFGLENIVGHDYKMLKIFDLIESVAESKATVLITGQSGTGKSLIARAIHHRSDRMEKPFVELSCGAMPETLLESELFGHVKGSFTGATGDKNGKFLAADGGTLFLDEINSASPALQMKLLRVLQERQFEPVGSNETKTVDVRVILATNSNLQEEVKAGRFREDLYYRINVVNIELPPLAQRKTDVPLLAEKFLAAMCKTHGKEKTGFTAEAVQYLERYHWPGNVRELENVVERGVVLGKNSQMGKEDLPQHLLDAVDQQKTGGFKQLSLREALEEPEKKILEATLRQHNWNRQVTADVLQINRTTLYKKMKYFGLESDPMMQSSLST
ncbi:MAG: Transcriptional regulatory protein ZraR [Planctomycetes bacterium ADurb.Bin412]|nr:MAG: Transcriptional regulatory protein ZraR [Planctomycetes bacterium ADurb.Bin412]